MPTLERHYELGPTSQVAALPEADEARARRDLRDQIAALEAQLGAAVSAEFPHLPVPRSGTSGAAARLLDLGALEGVRDQLADRLLALRREAATGGCGSTPPTSASPAARAGRLGPGSACSACSWGGGASSSPPAVH